jgi:hypothetical protein
MPLASLQHEPIGIFAENVEVGWTHASEIMALMRFQLTKHFGVVLLGCKEVDCFDEGRAKAL